MRFGLKLASLVLATALPLSSAAAGQPGHPLYDQLSDADRAQAVTTVQDALVHRLSGQSSTWRGTAAGVRGSVTPLRTFRIVTGHWCREFQETVILPALAEVRVLTACRSQDDGRWIVVGPGS